MRLFILALSILALVGVGTCTPSLDALKTATSQSQQALSLPSFNPSPSSTSPPPLKLQVRHIDKAAVPPREPDLGHVKHFARKPTSNTFHGPNSVRPLIPQLLTQAKPTTTSNPSSTFQTVRTSRTANDLEGSFSSARVEAWAKHVTVSKIAAAKPTVPLCSFNRVKGVYDCPEPTELAGLICSFVREKGEYVCGD